MTTRLDEFNRLTTRLHRLQVAGRDDSPEAEEIRALGDPLWHAMTDDERREAAGYSQLLGNRQEFIRLVHAAYLSLAEVRCHRLCGPGLKGIQEELLSVAGITHDEMMAAVDPGWPSTVSNPDPERPHGQT